MMLVFQCSVVNFPLLTAALKEYASDSAIDLVEACFHLDFNDRGDNGDDGDNLMVILVMIMTMKKLLW